MRFPIRSQILLPTSIVMVAAVLGSFAVSVWLAQRSARSRIQERIDDVTLILEQATFPLTDRVLQQMAGLTGADFVLVDETGRVTGASESSLSSAEALRAKQTGNTFGEAVRIADNEYFHRILPVKQFPIRNESATSCVLSRGRVPTHLAAGAGSNAHRGGYRTSGSDCVCVLDRRFRQQIDSCNRWPASKYLRRQLRGLRVTSAQR